jgi:hypothetical protein
MGRIDLSSLNDGGSSQQSRPTSSSANRSHVSSPSIGSSNGQMRKAKVNMNSMVSGSGTVHSNGLPSSRPPLSASSAYSSPHVRSPFQQSGFDPIMSPSNGERSTSVPQSNMFHVRSADGSASSSRTTTRSPSPTRLYAGVMRSANASSSSSLQSQNRRSESPSLPVTKARVRPVSTIQSQESTLAGIHSRTATPSFTAKVTNPSYDNTPTAKHARSNSYATPLVKNAFHPARPPLQRSASRSPSPTLTRSSYGRDGRRISHGSNVSTGGQSSTSGTQSNSIGRSSFNAAPKRPSLTAMSTQFANASFGDSYVGSSSGTALESPNHLPSPSSTGDGSAFRSGPLTSPIANGLLPSPNVLLSPTVELDAEQLEAKTNRKILDLEITNKSLLAINGGLEVVKLKQAREIRELKKRLREGRTLGDTLGIQDRESGEVSESDLEDDESVSDEEAPLNTELEEAHQRCKGLIDAMVAQARHAILSKHEPEINSSGNRVLHPAEVDAMQNENEGSQVKRLDGGDGQSDSEAEEDDADTSRLPDITNETSISQELEGENDSASKSTS